MPSRGGNTYYTLRILAPIVNTKGIVDLSVLLYLFVEVATKYVIYFIAVLFCAHRLSRMSVVSEVLETGKLFSDKVDFFSLRVLCEVGSDNGASPKTPKGRNLIQGGLFSVKMFLELVLIVYVFILGRLPFTAVDNKNMKITDKHKHSLSTEHINKTPIKAPSTENDSNLDVAMNEDAKLHSILDESDEHNCIQSSSYVEEEMESELDTSHVSLDELGKTTPSRKPLTPKQFEREKKKLEKIKEKEVFKIKIHYVTL